MLAVTVAVWLAGPVLLRHRATGAAVFLAGLGAPVRWSAGSVHGVVSLRAYPPLFLATAVIALTAAIAGWFGAARRRSGAVVGCAGVAYLAAAATSHTTVHLGELSAHLHVGAQSALVAALWPAAVYAAVASVRRRHPHLHAASPTTFHGRDRWMARVPAFGVVSTATAVLVLGACGGTTSGLALAAGPHNAPADSTTTLVTTPPTTQASAAAPGTTSSTAAASSQRGAVALATTRAKTTTTARASSGAPATAASMGWPAPTAGVYSYDTSGSTSSLLGNKSFPAVTTLTVDAPSGTKQHSLRELVAANGDGFVIDQTLDYQHGGIAVVQQRLSMTQGGNKTVRTLTATPTTVVIPIGAPLGSHADFALTGSTIDGHEIVDILSGTPVTVGGQSVATVLVKSVLTVTGNVSGTIELDQWWSAGSRLPVKEHVTGTLKSGLVSVKTHYDATMRTLTPA